MHKLHQTGILAILITSASQEPPTHSWSNRNVVKSMGMDTWMDGLKARSDKLQCKGDNICSFSGGPVVRTWDLHSWGPSLMPSQGPEILQARQWGQKKKRWNFWTQKREGLDWPHLDIKEVEIWVTEMEKGVLRDWYSQDKQNDDFLWG